MGSNVDKLESELKKAHSEIKKLSLQLKKGSDPKVVKQIRDLMVKYNDTNLNKAYQAAAQKDAAYFSKTLSDIAPGL